MGRHKAVLPILIIVGLGISVQGNAAMLDEQNLKSRAVDCHDPRSERCEARLQQENACTIYASVAFNAFGMKDAGYPLQVVSDSMARQAYGAGGIAFQGSPDLEILYRHIVAAAFFGHDLYGKTPQQFSDYAYNTCVRGDFF